MLILALDTATKASGVALADENTLLAEIVVEGNDFHSETLINHIDMALKIAGAEKKDLSGIAVDVGPGSFTGLRIGIAAAKAMAYALNLPLAGVTSLAAMAAGLYGFGGRIFSLIDAQKASAYVAGYVFDGENLRAEYPVKIMKVQDFLEFAAELEGEIVLTGDAAKKRLTAAELPKNIRLAPPRLLMPRASEVARLGLKKLAAGECADLMTLEPLYLRRSEAEILWDKRHADNS